MMTAVMTSSINVNQETSYKKRRGLLREYYVNCVIWQAYFSRGSISSQKRPDRVWGLLGLLRNGYRVSVRLGGGS